MPTPGYTNMNIRLPEPVAKRLKATAAERMVNPSIIVANAVDSFLAALAPIPTVTAHVVDEPDDAEQ